jgi:hypothetical protein
MISISPVLPGTPGDCRRESLRVKETDVFLFLFFEN